MDEYTHLPDEQDINEDIPLIQEDVRNFSTMLLTLHGSLSNKEIHYNAMRLQLCFHRLYYANYYLLKMVI